MLNFWLTESKKVCYYNSMNQILISMFHVSTESTEMKHTTDATGIDQTLADYVLVITTVANLAFN